MSNPTTPFSWQMPTATDLVTDLPADFEVFGQAVATSMADLLGGTTGQVLSKTSNTDMDFTWIANDQGDITGVTAGVGISGGGTSGTVTITNSMATAITTAGDTIYGTGSGTFSRLGIGSTSQVLTVAGGVPTWATPSSGSLTLLSTTTLSGASTTISGISGSYKNLQIVITGANISTAAQIYFWAQAAGTNSAYSGTSGNNNTFAVDGQRNNVVQTPNNVDGSSVVNGFVWNIYDYASATKRKTFQFTGGYEVSTNPASMNIGGLIERTAAITAIRIEPSAGTFSAGTVLIYGVN
jgi:hypothetical protein